MTFNMIKDMINSSDSIAYRKEWNKDNTNVSNIFIKRVNDATTKRGSFGVRVKQFIAKSNSNDYGMEVYYPTDEDMCATDWYIN